MNLYFAPLEGITTYTYRNTHAEMFGGCDKYFAPFITPTANEKVGLKVLRDILPEKNNTERLVVQMLSSQPEAFLNFAEKIKAFGYDEINLNFGCPSSTVVKKDRGAGALRDISALDNFLAGVFEKSDIKISVKTRVGFWSGDEVGELMEVYNKYPISQLVVHPRAREDYYNGVPNMTAFEKAYSLAKMPVCYNGDVFSAEDFYGIEQRFSLLEGVMLGRGAVSNPAIFREIKGGARLKTNELAEFTARLKDRYLEVLGSEVYTLHKLKEIWMYIMWNFPDEKKIFGTEEWFAMDN
ncbi:MAG: tRNA-dihydrouridine synthase family protein, partial [Clostridia bacterium]|nr:tRNA-dihydrouridine synthase family protein [Clostridia bacterium]